MIMAPAKTYVIKNTVKPYLEYWHILEDREIGYAHEKTVELLFEIKTITIVCIRYFAP